VSALPYPDLVRRWLMLGLLLGCTHRQPVRSAYAPSLVRTQPFHTNFIPFGAGQVQNGHCGKAVALATAQGVTAATSAGIWLYLMHRYGPNAAIPPEDGLRVRRLQQLEIATGVAFFALYAYGVIDGIRHYEPSVVVHPMAVSDGAGAGVSWSY
jgi:hypothetical protein